MPEQVNAIGERVCAALPAQCLQHGHAFRLRKVEMETKSLVQMDHLVAHIGCKDAGIVGSKTDDRLWFVRAAQAKSTEQMVFRMVIIDRDPHVARRWAFDGDLSPSAIPSFFLVFFSMAQRATRI